ncbi:MAG: T9SS type A sorting domain-containing protein [Bacteroidia bacterium]
MKKIITTLFLSSLSTFSFCQNLRFLEHGSATPAQAVYNVNVDASLGDAYDLDIENMSSNALNLKIRKTVVSTPVGCATPNDVIFCDPVNCYSNPATNVGVAFPINANQVIDPSPNLYGLRADLLAGSCLGTYIVRYKVFNTAAPNTDTASVTFIYNVTPTAIAAIDAKNFMLSAALPNPASTNATIKYDFAAVPSTASIRIFNTVGALVKEFKLEGQEGKVSIDASSLEDGMYFYTLSVNNKPVSTKKLLVNH